MYCKFCGKQIDDDSIFCRYCGRRVDQPVDTPKRGDVLYRIPFEPIDNAPLPPQLEEALKQNLDFQRRDITYEVTTTIDFSVPETLTRDILISSVLFSEGGDELVPSIHTNVPRLIVIVELNKDEVDYFYSHVNIGNFEQIEENGKIIAYANFFDLYEAGRAFVQAIESMMHLSCKELKFFTNLIDFTSKQQEQKRLKKLANRLYATLRAHYQLPHYDRQLEELEKRVGRFNELIKKYDYSDTYLLQSANSLVGKFTPKEETSEMSYFAKVKLAGNNGYIESEFLRACTFSNRLWGIREMPTPPDVIPLIDRADVREYIQLQYDKFIADESLLSRRAINLCKKMMSSYENMVYVFESGQISPLNDSRSTGRATERELADFYNKKLKPFIEKALEMNERDVRLGVLGIKYPFLQPQELEFVVDFENEHGHLPVFFILRSYVCHSGLKENKIINWAVGFEGAPMDRKEVASKEGLTAERVRQIVAAGIYFGRQNEGKRRQLDSDNSQLAWLMELVKKNAIHYQDLLTDEQLTPESEAYRTTITREQLGENFEAFTLTMKAIKQLAEGTPAANFLAPAVSPPSTKI